MARTDKDVPLRIRKGRNEWGTPSKRAASYKERGSGEKGVRFAKRYASKARRRGDEHPYKIKSLTQTYIYNSG